MVDVDDENQLATVIGLIVKAIDIWTLYPALDFVRGGWTAFCDHRSYNAAEYRNGVATGLSVIDGMPALMADDRRIEMPISHQGPKPGPDKRP